MIEIKDISGKVLFSVLLNENSKLVEELMTSDYIQLSWVSDNGAIIPISSYVEYNGEKYRLLEPYTPQMDNELKYVYTPIFHSRVMVWDKHIVPVYTYSEDGNTVISKEFDWSFTGSPVDAMYIIKQAIKNETGEDWTIQLSDSLPATITISSQSSSIFSILNSIASECKTEWWADKKTNTLYLSKCIFGESITLEVGNNVQVPSVATDSEGYYTRFYAFGSTRNIVQGPTQSGTVVNNRLTLDPVKYPNGYKDIREGLKQNEIFVKVLYFDEIYPSSKLTISDVRARLRYRLDNAGQKIQIGGTEEEPVYEQYAIWYFQIADFSFNADMIIEGKKLSVSFESGQLASRDFELAYHEKTETVSDANDVTPFEVKAGDYEIIIDETSGQIIPGVAYIIPQNGDSVILYNIQMPAEYTASAQAELEKELDKAMAYYTEDNNSYQIQSDPTWFYTNKTDISMGQAVTFINGTKSLSTRVLMVEKRLDLPCYQTIKVGNKVIKGNTQQLKDEVASVNQNIDVIQAFNELSASLSQAYANAQREMIEGLAAIKDLWQLKQDEQGNFYAYSKYDVLSKGGMTAYSAGNVEVPSIFDGLPLDNVTIWKNPETGLIEVIGGTGDDFDATAMWAALSADTNEQINISHLTDALSGYAIKSELNISNWDDAYNKRHTHSNKAVLDGITSEKVTQWNTAYGWGNHASAGYAKQTALDAVSTKLNDFLEGSDTDTIINKWKELEAFLEGMSESDNLAEILGTKADKTYVDGELKKYVTLSTEQTISGLKHFTNGLTLGAGKHKLYEKDGNIILDGNLLVTGGVTAYSTGEGSSGGGGGIDVEVLWEILGGTGDQQINVSHLTDALTWNNISNKPSTFTPSAHNHAIADVTNLSTELGKKVSSVTVTGTGNAITAASVANGVLTLTKGATYNNYSLPLASSTVRGGVKVGYAENGRNYPVELSNEQMFVNVPWTDTKYTLSSFGISATASEINKLDGATITTTELNYLKGVTSNVQTQLNNSFKEANLQWGGKNFAGSYGCIDAAMIPDLGANRLAFMPADSIEVQYSRDGGITWSEYPTTDTNKLNFFNGNGSSHTIGASSSTGIDKSKYQLRFIITTNTAKVYTVLNKFCIYCSTNGSSGSWCTIDAKTKSNVDAGNDTWTTFANKVPISGWSGYNIINTSGITTYGNQTYHFQKLRFTFGVNSHLSTSTYAGLSVFKIYGFGGVGWTTPSNMARYGRIYSYDSQQNVTFPGSITASGFKGNADTATILETARTINGTSFDGSANITTAKWGTSRNIYIRDASQAHTGAAVSVDGSTNEYLLLPSTITASLVGNADTATKLQTPRTLWGQSFDGTANISGNMTNVGSITSSGVLTLIGKTDIHFKRNGADNNSLVLSANTFRPFGAANNLIDLGISTAKWRNLYLGNNAFIDGLIKIQASASDTTHQLNISCESAYSKIQSNGGIPLAINPDGNNVGIGKTNPTKRLDVNGSTATTDLFIDGIRLYKSADGTIKLDGNLLVTGGITAYSTGEEGGGSSGGGIDVELLWEILGGEGEQQINIAHLTDALNGYATQSWVTSQDYLKSVSLATISDLHSSWDAVLKAQKPNYLTSVSIATISDLNSSWDTLLKTAPSVYVTRHPTISEVTGKQNLIIKLNSGTTEGTNLFTYNGTAAKTVNITPSAIGAAASSHNHSWSNITSGKPTTLSGYGITDAYTKTQANSTFVNVAGDTMTGALKISSGGIVASSTLGNGVRLVGDDSGGWAQFGAMSDNPTNKVGTISAFGGYDLTSLNIKISNNGLTVNNNKVWHAGNDGHGSGLDADLFDGQQKSSFFVEFRNSLNLSAIDNFVNRESGTYIVSGTGASGLLTVFKCDGGSTSALELFTWYDWSKARIRMTIDSNRYSSWKDLAFLDSNVASATKLKTARTIWGQSFDGTSNIYGDLTVYDNEVLKIKTTKGDGIGFQCSNSYARGLGHLDSNNTMTFAAAGILCYANDDIQYSYYGGVYNSPAMVIRSNLNVGIGTTSPSQKLDVNGTARGNGLASNNIRIECDNNGLFGSRNNEINNYNGPLQLQYNTSQQLHLCYGGGNVGIGITSPTQKLDVNGAIRIRGSVGSNAIINSDTLNNIYFQANGNTILTLDYEGKCARPATASNNMYDLGHTSYRWRNLYLASSAYINGNVGIGTNAPSEKLDVNGKFRNVSNGDVATGAISFKSLAYSTSPFGLVTRIYQTGCVALQSQREAKDTETFSIALNPAGGKVGVGTLSPSVKFHVVGDILSTGGITCYSSDQRAKTVLEHIDLKLKDIANAPTIRFKWNNWRIKDDGKTHIGGIAQYTQMLLPEAVLEADNALNMDYATTGYIFAVQTAKYLVKTDTEVEKLKKRVKKLEKQLKKLGYEETNIVDD